MNYSAHTGSLACMVMQCESSKAKFINSTWEAAIRQIGGERAQSCPYGKRLVRVVFEAAQRAQKQRPAE